MVMTRSQFRKRLQQGLNAQFGLTYDEYPDEWTELFVTQTAEKAVEEQTMEMGLGAARVKPEGAGVSYDEGRELWFSRFEAETIALAFAITEEAEEDNLYGSLGAKYAKALARSMKYTKNIKGAAVLNNGFDTAYTGGDGKPLFSTTHPLGGGGTYANKLSTPADFSESSVEACSILASSFVDERGIPVPARIKYLGVSKEQEFIVERVLGNPDRPATADRDINAVYKRKTVPNWGINHFFTDPDAYFFITDIDGGLQYFKRIALKKGIEGDFNTGNMRYKARERYVFGWHDPKGAVGSEGA